MIYHTTGDALVLSRLLELVKSTRSCPTLAALRLLPYSSIATGHLVVCDSAGDSAMHLYRWNAASTATDDGVNVVKPTGLVGAGPNNGTLTLYDNTSASGPILWAFTLPATVTPDCYEIGVPFSTGLTAVLSAGTWKLSIIID